MSPLLCKARQGLSHAAPSWMKALAAVSSPQAAFSSAAQLNSEPYSDAEALERTAWSSYQALEPQVIDLDKPRWVFLGCPGVGKGTYASRLSKLLDIPHISTGDLVRAEVKRGTSSSMKLEAEMKKGRLIPDEVIFDLLSRRLEQGNEAGEGGFILDGFPRTTTQAAILNKVTSLDLVVNLRVREEVLINKCLGRRTCSECGGNFNVADIFLPATLTEPEIIMPPLSPPQGCLSKMLVRSDDTEAVVRMRLDNYRKETLPVEEYYRSRDMLLDFNIVGGIPETWPRLLSALKLDYRVEEDMPKAA